MNISMNSGYLYWDTDWFINHMIDFSIDLKGVLSIFRNMASLDNSKKILSAFMGKPSESKYIREVSRECGLSYERTQHYLGEMEKINAMRSKNRGKIKEYALNKEHELVLKLFSFLEMERRQEFYSKKSRIAVWLGNMVGEFTSADSPRSLLSKSKSEIKFIVLFGSCARGESKAKSDVDILVVVRNKDKAFEIESKKISGEMCALSGRKFSLNVVEIKELRGKWNKEPVYSTLWLDRIVLYGEENFWREVLELGEPV